MSIRRTAHVQAVTELLELMNLAFMIALLSDCCWVIRDMYVNGVTVGLTLIAIALWVGFVIVLVGFIKYHQKQVKEIICRITKERLKMCKARAKACARGKIKA